MKGFIFGGNTGVTPEELARRRALAASLMPQSGSRNLGEGIGNAGRTLASAWIARQANKDEDTARDASGKANSAAIARALGGFAGGQASATPAAAPARPDALVQAVMRQESGGNPNAVSPKGAMGLMQLMPGTARDPGFGVQGTAEPFDPQENMRVGSDYLNAMLERYGGDTQRALVAYNWGPANADKWDGRMESLPAETRQYVQNITANTAQPQSAPQAVGTAPQVAQTGGVDPATVQALMGVMGDDFADPGQQAVAQLLLGRAFEQPEAMTPYQQAQLDLQRRRLDAQLSGQLSDATSVTVNNQGAPQVGTIPQGWQLVQDGNALRMEPVPGGPAAQEIAQTETAREKAGEVTDRYGGVVLEDIGRVRERVEQSPFFTTGLPGSVLKQVPGTNAYDVASLTDTIRANIGFDRLQQMRESSPTGGALGQVTERELAFLQATLGNLEQSQSQDQFMRNLDRLENVYLDIVHGPGNRPQNRPQSPSAPNGGVPPVPEGTGITAEEWPSIWNAMTPEERALWQS